jgi:hypothetical protein
MSSNGKRQSLSTDREEKAECRERQCRQQKCQQWERDAAHSIREEPPRAIAVIQQRSEEAGDDEEGRHAEDVDEEQKDVECHVSRRIVERPRLAERLLRVTGRRVQDETEQHHRGTQRIE